MALSPRAKNWIKRIAIGTIAVAALRGACRETRNESMRKEMLQEIQRLEEEIAIQRKVIKSLIPKEQESITRELERNVRDLDPDYEAMSKRINVGVNEGAIDVPVEIHEKDIRLKKLIEQIKHKLSSSPEPEDKKTPRPEPPKIVPKIIKTFPSRPQARRRKGWNRINRQRR